MAAYFWQRCIITVVFDLYHIRRPLQYPIPSPGMITVLHIIALTFYNLNPTSKLLGSTRVQGKTVMMHFQSRFQYTSTGRMDRLYPGRAQFIHAAGTGILESGLKVHHYSCVRSLPHTTTVTIPTPRSSGFVV